ncbi:hypothetical protein CBR_g37377 [Chara braunii]|uniref:Integrase catalytic domain-containing protein n=1 Tax=Chara braunii TaxID=69332 RepID=A0A388JZP6_CHABU|nr:hypothetical protein CBR_g37377 [Chara braunii]|eukprot:GBG63291.1 hypothetical protein CBR_g37377 [Chara braunii]
MKKRHRAYVFNDDQRGRLDVDKIPMIQIHTVPHEPWNLRGARYPNPDEEKIVVDYLDGKMRTHVAGYSSGPYASPWFCFIKPNGTLRWVQVLQRLNAVTVRDAGGLPNADALSESCAGRPIISLIDLYYGYDQFPVYPPDRPVTAMHTPRGLIHMNVAPQGWTNAVAMVQRHMIRAMQTVSPHITHPYIDDLAVKGPKEKEEDEVQPKVRHFVWRHIQDLDLVLGLLEEYNLTASGPKSKHCMREATVPGFVCNEKGRKPDVKKADKILEWPIPFQSITDVRSFLGTCGFWRSFVKDFAAKTEHLRKLVRQDQEWVWGEDQEQAVTRMKGEFREGGLVLGAPNYEGTEERPFIIETDAGPTALGGVLIQADAEGKERPLRFESRTLNTTERNYSQFKRETLAVLHCLRIFRNYVFGRRFILRVDPTALACSLKNCTPSNPTIARWLTYIWMFNFELESIPGNRNRPHGLSRVNWDSGNQESTEDTPPVDGFLDQEEDVRLHINEWPLRVPNCVSHPIWIAPRGYERKTDLVLKPFQEEDLWGGKDVQWMMRLALAGMHDLVEEVRAIEEGPTQVEEHEQLMGGMYVLTNTLVQGDFDQRNSLSPMEREGLIPESQDDEFEEGEIKEAFRAEEYDGIYLELRLLLSCEMRDRDASDKAQKMRHLYAVRDGHLFIKRQVVSPKRVVCERNRQLDIIAALHDGIAEGHKGIGATCAKISELYHWDGMLSMVIKYCQSCVPCQERSAQRPGEPLHPRLETEVGAIVHLDLLFMPAAENGCNYIFDARNNLTGFVDGRAIRLKTGRVLANCIEEYYLRYPFVKEFVMDRGSEFTCKEVQLAGYGVVANYTTAAHPQANAPVERGHSTITNLLAKWTEGRPGQWPKFLRAAFFVENVTVKRTTKNAPATLWYGRHATFPIKSFLKTWRRTCRLKSCSISGHGRWGQQRKGYERPPRVSPMDPSGEERIRPEPEAEPLRLKGVGAKDVIVVEGDTHPVSPTRVQMRRSWPEGVPEPDSQEAPVPPPEVAMSPRQEVEARGPAERWRTEPRLVIDSRLAAHATEHPDIEGPSLAGPSSGPACAEVEGGMRAATGEVTEAGTGKEPDKAAQAKRAKVQARLAEIHPRRDRMEAAGIAPTPPVDPKTKERAQNEAWRARLEAKEAEWDEKLKGMAAVVESLSATKVVDWTEQSRYDIQGEGVQELFGQEEVAEASRQEKLRKLEAQRGEPSRLDELVAAMEVDMPPERPRGLETPKHEPKMGELRAQLGSWATGTDSGGPTTDQQQQEATSQPTRAANPQTPRPRESEEAAMVEGTREGRPLRLDTHEYQPKGGMQQGESSAQEIGGRAERPWHLPQSHEVSEEKGEAPPSSGTQRKKKRFQRKSEAMCFYFLDGVHRALKCPKFLKDKAEGRVTEQDGKMYNRRGRVVERAPDGGRAQLFRQHQEEMSE